MSNNNPTATLPRPRTSVTFCLGTHPEHADWICTRIETHNGHCCDEIARKAWENNGRPMECKRDGYNHSKEKGLVRG